MSWGPVVWVLLGEMFPNRIRAAALGLAAAGQWAANWAITVSFPALRETLGLAYGFYAVCAVLSDSSCGDGSRRPRACTWRTCTARRTTTRRIPPGTELPRARRETAVTLLAGAWNNRVP